MALLDIAGTGINESLANEQTETDNFLPQQHSFCFIFQLPGSLQGRSILLHHVESQPISRNNLNFSYFYTLYLKNNKETFIGFARQQSFGT